jgi:glycerol-3-phosphate acyltransferase PlsX
VVSEAAEREERPAEADRRARAPRAAALLGVGGTAVVCHGAATADDVASGIMLAALLHRRAATPAMSALLTHLAEVTL